MTEYGLLTLFLFLHVIAAIIAFGPTFIFPIIGAMGGRERAHTNFGLRVSATISDRVVIPFALSMPVTGLFLIYYSHRDLSDRSNLWLGLAIVLYVAAVSIAIFAQRPTVMKLIAMTSAPPPGAGGPPASAAPPPASAAAPRVPVGLRLVDLRPEPPPARHPRSSPW